MFKRSPFWVVQQFRNETNLEQILTVYFVASPAGLRCLPCRSMEG